MGEEGYLFVVIADIFQHCHTLIGKERSQTGTIERHVRFNVLMGAIGPTYRYAAHTAVLANERLYCFTSNNISAARLGLLEHHAIEMAATNLPGRSGRQLPVRSAGTHWDKPAIGAARSINFH